MNGALQDPMTFVLVCGAWAIGMVAVFVSVLRMCTAIEIRSGRQGAGIPGLANIWQAAINKGVADDEQTQRLRWRMNQRLLVILAGFLVFGVILREAGA